MGGSARLLLGHRLRAKRRGSAGRRWRCALPPKKSQKQLRGLRQEENRRSPLSKSQLCRLPRPKLRYHPLLMHVRRHRHR